MQAQSFDKILGLKSPFGRRIKKTRPEDNSHRGPVLAQTNDNDSCVPTQTDTTACDDNLAVKEKTASDIIKADTFRKLRQYGYVVNCKDGSINIKHPVTNQSVVLDDSETSLNHCAKMLGQCECLNETLDYVGRARSAGLIKIEIVYPMPNVDGYIRFYDLNICFRPCFSFYKEDYGELRQLCNDYFHKFALIALYKPAFEQRSNISIVLEDECFHYRLNGTNSDNSGRSRRDFLYTQEGVRAFLSEIGAEYTSPEDLVAYSPYQIVRPIQEKDLHFSDDEDF